MAGSMTRRVKTLIEQFEFIEVMHDRLRVLCPEPGTDEGHFVNENTIIRLAAFLDGTNLKPSSELEAIGKNPTDEVFNKWFDGMTDSEKAVRVLFRFRHCIVHQNGRLLDNKRFTLGERNCYAWFCDNYPEARVVLNEKLCLPYNTVIAPLIAGCKQYMREADERYWLERLGHSNH